MAPAQTPRAPRRGRPPKAPSPADAVARAPDPLNGALARLVALRGTLAPTGRRIADYIIANAADVVHMSVTELAERTQASEGSVIGLCQQLEARGFQHLKIALAQDLGKVSPQIRAEPWLVEPFIGPDRGGIHRGVHGRIMTGRRRARLAGLRSLARSTTPGTRALCTAQALRRHRASDGALPWRTLL